MNKLKTNVQKKEGRPKGTRQGQGMNSKPSHGRKKMRGQGKG
jgi:hypothetical protein